MTVSRRTFSNRADLVTPTGITGATSGARFVGATTSGAPTTGTFAVGDYIVDRSGAMYVCTAAGSPGTWVKVGKSEIASVEKTDANFTTTTTGQLVDIAGMSVSFTVVDDPVYLYFGASDMSHSAANTNCLLECVVDSTVTQFVRGSHATAGGRIPVGMQMARVSSAGAHTAKLSVLNGGAGTLTVLASANDPIYLRAVRM